MVRIGDRASVLDSSWPLAAARSQLFNVVRGDWSAWGDVKLMLRTIPVVIRRGGL